MNQQLPQAIRIAYLTRANLTLRRAHTRNILKTVQALNHQEYVLCELYTEYILSKLWNNRNKYDVVYFRDHHLVGHAMFARFLLSKKVIYEVHSTHGKLYVRKLAVAISNGVVFITEKLKEYYNIRKPSVVVHCNGVDMELFEITESQEALRTTFGLPLDKKLVLYVGSTQWYDLTVLLDMLKHLQEQVMVLLVGLKDQELEEMQKLVGRRKLGSRVMLRRRVPQQEVFKYLSAADILVNPLSADLPGSISSKLYEYFASGRPIVSTQGGANCEILRDGENALVAKLTGKDFAHKVTQILDDVGVAQSLGERARQEAAKYSWDERAKNIISLYKKIA